MKKIKELSPGRRRKEMWEGRREKVTFIIYSVLKFVKLNMTFKE